MDILLKLTQLPIEPSRTSSRQDRRRPIYPFGLKAWPILPRDTPVSGNEDDSGVAGTAGAWIACADVRFA
ncbi:hypothetical protein GCM10027598_58640 [Amycolatopsis oliviviridis]|uniref:Uncharacterized protein n=1 Tax=Amycolatopsis oliviviridis TaxID=1471590 RepID=A0ABQ3LX21_9PSEU|nr:hypothetical protein GCM10017790_59290 [Amycolatopsis oliviviridis]